MSRFRIELFGSLTVIGIAILVGEFYYFGLLYPITIEPGGSNLAIWLFFPPAMLAIIAGGLLVYFHSTPEEVQAKQARLDAETRQYWMTRASNFETAGRYNEAAAIYEQWGLLADAGRARSAARVREIKVTGVVGTGQTTVVKEKETIIKELVMIPCKYCGVLMPQTSIFCPNCGARRKA